MYDEILTSISTVGFPIVCCAAMFWNNVQMQKNHQEEAEKFQEALNNNTLALQKLGLLLDEKKEG